MLFVQRTRGRWRLGSGLLVLALVIMLIGGQAAPGTPAASYLVQAADAPTAARRVQDAGGQVIRALGLIGAVEATLDSRALGTLRQTAGVRLHANGVLAAADSGHETTTAGYLLYPAAATGAHLLHEQQVPTRKTECKGGRVIPSSETTQRDLQGWGVTVAVIDSGLMPMASSGDWTYRTNGTLIAENSGRCLIYRDFLPRTSANGNLDPNNSIDQHGHGTHVLATIGDNREEPLAPGRNATPLGVAPEANLLVARALNKDGVGTYADVIAAIDWIVANKSRYNIRVLNLSLYAPVRGPYWADPLNQAVMRAWQSGIVVIAAAGNSGPAAGTITAPGNVPYVITVGAVKSGRYTTSGFDELAAYSSRGPTESAFVKPDVVIPASRTIAPVPNGSTLATQLPAARVHTQTNLDLKVGAASQQHTYYQLSGTSMAAAEVSGIVALMLQRQPTLTNDQVKYRLASTARLALNGTTPAYSVWEQGAGLVSTQDAVFGTSTAAANGGMQIATDLTTDTHYVGFTRWNAATGTFELLNNPVGGGSYQSWAGSYQSWAGSYQSWAGSYQSWAGSYQSWAGSYQSWAGSYQSWAGSLSYWAGADRTWAGSLPSQAPSTAFHGNVIVSE